MKRILIIRNVTKDGRYTRHWGIRLWDWNVDLPVTHKAIVISVGTRDIIICYRKMYRMLEGGTIQKRTERQQIKYNQQTKGRFPCKKYGGYCPEDNFCPGLRNPRGGDFGWGECISRERE